MPAEDRGVRGNVIKPKSIGDGPITFSSQYSTYQQAIDAAGQGLLFIDDTKREENITLSLNTPNDGIDIIGLGDNWVEKPTNPTNGVPTFNTNGSVSNVRFVNIKIRNPDLGDGDIGNQSTIAGGDQRDGISHSGGAAVNWEIISPTIHHIQGYGIRITLAEDTLTVRDGNIWRVAFDSYYARDDNGESARFIDCYSGWSGRHNYAIANNSSSSNEENVITGCYGEDAFTAGIDLEDAGRTHLEATIQNASRSNNSGSVNSGLNVSADSGPVSGTFKSVDHNVQAADITGETEGLTIISERSANEANPNGVTPVVINGVGSERQHDITVKVIRGGNTSGAVSLTDVDGGHIEIIGRETQGATVSLVGVQKSVIHVVSKEPVQDSANVTGEYQSHIAVKDSSNRVSQDNDVTIVARDLDGGVENAVYDDSDGSGYSRYSGNVRNAYSNQATYLPGTGDDDTDLMI